MLKKIENKCKKRLKTESKSHELFAAKKDFDKKEKS
jgi:hypothetical protein